MTKLTTDYSDYSEEWTRASELYGPEYATRELWRQLSEELQYEVGQFQGLLPAAIRNMAGGRTALITPSSLLKKYNTLWNAIRNRLGGEKSALAKDGFLAIWKSILAVERNEGTGPGRRPPEQSAGTGLSPRTSAARVPGLI